MKEGVHDFPCRSSRVILNCINTSDHIQKYFASTRHKTSYLFDLAYNTYQNASKLNFNSFKFKVNSKIRI